jgi:molecular chaperone DnaJ
MQIPRGIQAGQTLRIQSKGNEGNKSGAEGHLFVRIQIEKHAFFERRGMDIFCDVPILWSEAVLGASVPVPTLTGSSLIRIPKATQSHRVFRLRNQGLPDTKGEDVGDIHYRIIVEVPILDTKLEEQVIAMHTSLLQAQHPSVQSFRTSISSSE